MTQQPQQLEFGDRVQDTEGRQFIFLRCHLSCCTVASSDRGTHVYLLDKIYPCATEPHPDTVRLDWLIKTKHAILPGWCGDVYADSREEIDAAMNTPTSQQIEKEQS